MPKSMEQKMVIAVMIMLAFALLHTLPAQPGKNGILGFVVYQGDAKGHEFALDSLSHNSTAVNVSGNELKLNLMMETKNYDTMETDIINISSAAYNGHDEITKIRNIDENYIETNKDKLFDIIFKNDLTNNTKIQLYLLNSDITEIYLCNYSQDCQSPGYGNVNYDGNSGYYNITVFRLKNNETNFNIDPPKVKFDYIRAIKEFNLTHEYNTSYYPMQAVAETDDFIPDSVYSWQSIIADESLNSQTIEYYYSTDSGSTWNYVTGKDISDADTSSGKIMLRILMTSDSVQTPAIRNLSITYSKRIVCNPEWEQQETICMNDDSRLVIYSDANSCNTTENLPFDNGTYAYCNYCTPEWQETNTSCLNDDTINQYFTDSNGCYGLTALQSDLNMPGNNTFSCDYCTPSITEYNTTCDDEEFMTYYDDENICYGATGLASDIIPANISNTCPNPSNTTQPNITNATGQEAGPGLFIVSITKPSENLAFEAATTVNFTAADISVENINISTATTLAQVDAVNITADSIMDNISSIKLIFYYSQTRIDEDGINESTLSVYYYDEGDEELQEIPSIIEIYQNFVEANVTHLSIYGLYGRLNQEDSGQTSQGQSTQQQASGSNQEEEKKDEPQLAAEAEPEQPPEEEPAGETAEAAEGQEGLSFETSPDYSYNSSEEAVGQGLYAVGRTIGTGLKNRSNAALFGVMFLMLIAAYAVIQIKARKGGMG